MWVPVFIGLGVAAYFAIPTEPPWFVVPMGAMVAGGVLAWSLVRRPDSWPLVVILGLMLLGFGAAQFRTWAVAAPVITKMTGAVEITGRVSLVEPIAERGGERVTLEDISFAHDGPLPRKVRLRFREGLPGVESGQRITVRATLLPPARPAIPGGYDFPRKAWYMGLGATGMALGPAEILEQATPNSAHLLLAHVRQTVSERIRAAVPGPSGAVAIAIITGEVTGIPGDVLAAYRNSGLAHILVIAGLHMGLLAGFVFFVVRGGLALCPGIALNYPIKKWAAGMALVVIGGYMALAGFPVPATRAFIMAAVVLVAVLLDRGALSLRLWAFAASIILLIEPEQITGPSFQMSFSAVAALIAVYESLGPWLAERARHHRGWVGRAGLHLLRLGLTSLVAGTATMVYGAYHFDRIALWQVFANLAAVPVVGVAVMPFALLALLAMPFGLEAAPLAVMATGLDVVTQIGFTVSNLPLALIPVPPLPVWGLCLFSLGGLWLCLWRRPWRRWGVVPMVLGLSSVALVQKPDVLVDEKSTGWGVRTEEGSLLVSRGGRVQRDTWAAKAGPEAMAFWPKHGRSGDGRLTCDDQWCLYRLDGHKVALVKDEDRLPDACAAADVVVTTFPVRDTCTAARVVIDRFDTWRYGAHEIWLDANGGVRVETVAAWQGNRPWSFKPPQRAQRPRLDQGGDDEGAD